MPPEPIADVLGAVLKLLGIHDVSWLSMKKFLGNRGVKDEILTFDAHRISGEMRKDVAKLLKNKASSFDHATITRVSVAAAARRVGQGEHPLLGRAREDRAARGRVHSRRSPGRPAAVVTF